MSTCDITQPPKMSPCWFASAGIGTTRNVGGLSGSVADSVVISRSVRRAGPRSAMLRGGLALHFVAKLPAQDLADVGLRQVLPEFDVARALVTRQVLAAMLQHGLRGQAFVFPDHEEL